MPERASKTAKNSAGTPRKICPWSDADKVVSAPGLQSSHSDAEKSCFASRLHLHALNASLSIPSRPKRHRGKTTFFRIPVFLRTSRTCGREGPLPKAVDAFQQKRLLSAREARQHFCSSGAAAPKIYKNDKPLLQSLSMDPAPGQKSHKALYPLNFGARSQSILPSSRCHIGPRLAKNFLRGKNDLFPQPFLRP
jgi:hypothetical protein